VTARKNAALVALLVLLLAVAGGQNRDQLREQNWHQDLEEVRQKLPKLHKDLFRKLLREKFQSELSAIEKAAPTLRDSEIIVALMRLIASVGDPHTQVDVDSAGFHDYPLELLWFPDGLHVIGTVRTHPELLGTRLVQIGDMPTATVLEKVVPVFPRVNLPWVQAVITEFVTKAEILSAQKAVVGEGSARFVFEDAMGKRIAVELSPMGGHERPRWISMPHKALRHKHNDLYYWYEYLPDSRTLYFNYSRCREMKQQPFRQFNDRMFKFIDSHPVERVVVDLRNNGGGSSEVIQPFVKEIKKRRAITKDGHFFVVIGRSTYSSGVMAAYEFVDDDDIEAVFVGSPTGGKPNFFGEVDEFRLTHSHLRILYSKNYFRLSTSDDTPSLFPDINVQLTWADYLAGRDPALDAILQYK
jgi:hypothetical protein